MARQTTLRGRDPECAALDSLLDVVRGGESRTLVLRGEAGIGKTALLDYAIGSATDFRVLRAVGVESEMELAFASLQQLCSPALDRLEHLPAPQQDALGVALGLRAGQTPDRFLVALAALTLLSGSAEERPLLCAVDDAQWLDEASAVTLAFVARRLLADAVAIVFVTREPVSTLGGLPELVLDGIGDDDARELLASVIAGPLDERVLETIVAETRGNPLALLELPHALTPAELAGGFALANAQPLTDRIQQSFLRRVRSLPPRSQQLLLTAAAEPLGDAVLLWQAAERLGIEADALGPAEAAGLIDVAARVRFRHPLVRSAVYGAAARADRWEVHGALAAATDPDADPDRRAWHRAHAAVGLDEDVAADLERSADRARARGGLAAAAAFLERATALTPDPARRGERALAAARAKLDAGAADAAASLLATAELGPLDALGSARLARLRGRIAFARRRGSDAPALLLEAARLLAPLDAALARDTYLEALGAAIVAGRLGGSLGVRELATAALAAPPGPQPPRPPDLLLDGLATMFTDGRTVGLPALRRALSPFRREVLTTSRPEIEPWLWFALPIAQEAGVHQLWDFDAWVELATGAVRLSREAGALAFLPVALMYLAGVHLHTGDFVTASAQIDEAEAITTATGYAPVSYASLVLVAWRGNEAAAREVIDAGVRDATARGEGMVLAVTGYATAVLYNGLGRYERAMRAALEACAHDDLSFVGWSLGELVEAGVRCGARAEASAALRQLEERADAADTDWARGIEARSRALLGENDEAELLYREAIERLERSRIAVQLARTHLVYGEWLRRENRRVDAREQLRTAHGMFATMGAEAFGERAARELLATGETVRKRTVETLGKLTAQEAQIARLARDGLSNPDIGAQLFISPRTVQYHLRKVFLKLEITSRNQLAGVAANRLIPA